MNVVKIAVLVVLTLFSLSSGANYRELIEDLALEIEEAKVVHEAGLFVSELNQLRKEGKAFDKKTAMEISDIVEEVAIHGCDCEDEINVMIRSQAHTIVGAITGIVSKDSKDVFLGNKSFDSLDKARQIDPNNTDAIKGQAVALKLILSENWLVRKNLISAALGISLNEAKKELISDLRRFPKREDLQNLAISSRGSKPLLAFLRIFMKLADLFSKSQGKKINLPIRDIVLIEFFINEGECAYSDPVPDDTLSKISPKSDTGARGHRYLPPAFRSYRTQLKKFLDLL